MIFENKKRKRLKMGEKDRTIASIIYKNQISSFH
jgi:hypothetical protein